MSLTAQTIRTILAALVTCLAIGSFVSNAAAQVTDQAEKKGSTIRGVVTYADTSRPLRHAAVNMIGDDNAAWQGRSITDGRGRFTLENVSAGRYLLIVDAPGILMPQAYARNAGSVAAQIRLEETRDLFKEIVVNGTDPVDVTLQAVRGGVITGRVITEDDQPVPDADIKLLKREDGKWVPVDFTWRGPDENKRKTDPSGVYRIARLHSGEYLVRVSEPKIGYDTMAHDDEAYSNGSLMVTYYPAANSIEEAQAVTVVEGSESTGVDIRMPDRTPRTISGTLTVGADDQPAAYADVLIERPDEVGFVSAIVESTTAADHEGKWVMHGVAQGEYDYRGPTATRRSAGEDFR